MIDQRLQNLITFINVAMFTTLLALGQLGFKQIGLGMNGPTLGLMLTQYSGQA